VTDKIGEPQEFDGLILSKPSGGTVAISTDVSRYVALTAAQLRWLVHEAGPRALEALDGS
jgi:hypothetical protein